MWGSRQTVIAALIVLAVSATIGVLSGLAAGFYRGKIEGVAGFLSDTIMSLPSIVLLIALYSLTGPNIPIAMAVFGVLVAPVFYRMVRSVTLVRATSCMLTPPGSSVSRTCGSWVGTCSGRSGRR